MTVEHLIEKLKDMDKDKVVVMLDPSEIGWTNIDNVEECESEVRIYEGVNGLFHES